MPELKRLVDLAVAGWLLVFLSPFFLLVALLVRVDSSGPVLFRHRRVGLHGRSFFMYKFRSMVADAAQIGGWRTSWDDPRITKVGRVLRRTSIDELPQLLNVIRGEMSLVGPRPDVEEQMSVYTEEERRTRHRVRPGITGLAQVMGRNEIGIERRKELDLAYARRHPLVMDFKIALLTLAQLTRRTK